MGTTPNAKKGQGRPPQSSTAKKTETIGDDNVDTGWTKNNHLVGTVIEGTALVLRERKVEPKSLTTSAGSSSKPRKQGVEVKQQSYACLEGGQILQISCFHPEISETRQPALYRGVFMPSSNPFASLLPVVADQQDDALFSAPSAWIPSTANTAVAIDRVDKDFTQKQEQEPEQQQDSVSSSSFLLAPPPGRNPILLSLEERLQSILYQHVVHEWLPPLILTAALEDINQQCIRQAARYQEEQESGGGRRGGRRNAATSNSSCTWQTPEYYRKSPTSYLAAPTATGTDSAEFSTDAASSSSSPAVLATMNFTPNQLVARIKQGCTMAYKHYNDHYHKPPPTVPVHVAAAPGAGNSSTTNGASDAMDWGNERRASSRIARQQEQQQQQQHQQLLQAISRSTTDTGSGMIQDHSSPLLWRVAEGGKIADYLMNNLILTELENVEDEEEKNEDDIDETHERNDAQIDSNSKAIEVQDAKLASMDKDPDPVASAEAAKVTEAANEKAEEDNSQVGAGGVDRSLPAVPVAKKVALQDPEPASRDAPDMVVEQINDDNISLSNPQPKTGGEEKQSMKDEVKLDSQLQLETAGNKKQFMKDEIKSESHPQLNTGGEEKQLMKDENKLQPRPQLKTAGGDQNQSMKDEIKSESHPPLNAGGGENRLMKDEVKLESHPQLETAGEEKQSMKDEIESESHPQLKTAGEERQSQNNKTSGDAAVPVDETGDNQNRKRKNSSSREAPGSDKTSDGETEALVDDEESAIITEKTNSKDDEDFNPTDDGDADEEDEEGSYVKENIQDLKIQEPSTGDKDDGDTEEEDDEDSEDENAEDAEDVDVVTFDNLYLSPSAHAVFEWLGCKTGKLLTAADLQNAFPALLYNDSIDKAKSKKKKLTAKNKTVGGDVDKLFSPLDRKIWERIAGSPDLNIGGPSARLAIKLFKEHEDNDVANWETSYFGRTQFTIRMIVDEQEDHDQFASLGVDLAAKEAAFKHQKAWDTWRYKGIHGGCTTWPSWDDAVRQWWEDFSSASVAVASDSNFDSVQVTSQADTGRDRELAEAVAEASTRRTTRRGGDTGVVFYGNQSSLTHKQLMDAVLRITSEKGYQTLSGLVLAVPDDSSDPLRRIRTSLGKLVWKRNQLARKTVETDWTDATVLDKLQESYLQRVGLGATSEDEAEHLNRYLQYLHRTELQLRKMIMKCLTSLSLAIVSTAADEPPGSQQCLDSDAFEDATTIEWHNSGHELLGKLIFRPLETRNTDDLSECHWFRVVAYSKSEASVSEGDEATAERPQIGSAEEPIAVKRRMRFRAVRTNIPEDGTVHADEMLLTEAQVHAGVLAAVEQNKRATKVKSGTNPFSNGEASRVTLFPVESDALSELCINGVVVGHNTVLGGDGEVRHTILVLPDTNSNRQDAFWATLCSTSEEALHCNIEGERSNFIIRQFEFHSSSPPFEECCAIAEYLERHPKTGPFREPVDPIALNIPQYRDIVKHPMDISTLFKKLESGAYSNIAPYENAGRSPIARMLNGPFRKDVELIFDNAMLFNPPDDWIHQSAFSIKKSVLKKIEQASNAADNKLRSSKYSSRSMYLDYDSDVDMYVYESDKDEDYDSPRKNRKRKRSAKTVLKEDSSARAIERPCRLQKVLSESTGLRGPFADLPVNTDPSSFALPEEWTCTHKVTVTESLVQETAQEDEEFNELIALQKQLDVNETAGLRRSTRAHVQEDAMVSQDSPVAPQVEYICLGAIKVNDGDEMTQPTSRLDVELYREKVHENYFAKIYRSNHKLLASDPDSNIEGHIGRFSNDSFPPYLGRTVPSVGTDNCAWEIRQPYVVAALRWVIRGLVSTNHLTAVEEVNSDSLSSGAVLANNIYYVDSEKDPFEVLDPKELIRKKRADQEADDSSEEEIELSEYEKLRAERVARNTERLKALGLA